VRPILSVVPAILTRTGMGDRIAAVIIPVPRVSFGTAPVAADPAGRHASIAV